MNFMQYDFSKYLIGLMEAFKPELITQGGYDAAQLDSLFRSLGLSEKIDLIIKTVNKLEVFDEILAPITRTSEIRTVEEIWINGDWHEGNTSTRSLGNKFQKRTLSLPAKYYDYQVNISRKDVLSALEMEATGGKSSMAGMELMLVNGIEGARKLQRKLALKAIFSNPVSEDPTLPVLYRNTTGFAAANQVIPPQNGLLTFETAAAQEHHLWQDGVSEDMIDKSRKLIVDKGGNGAALITIGSEASWKKFTAQFTAAELDKLNLVRTLGIENIAPSPLTSTINMVLPDSDMPVDYFVTIDFSRILLNKTESSIPSMRGIVTGFDTLSDLMNMNGASEITPVLINEANSQLKSAVVNGSIKFEMHELGYGVVNCGGAAVMFFGTGATEYVEPTWDI